MGLVDDVTVYVCVCMPTWTIQERYRGTTICSGTKTFGSHPSFDEFHESDGFGAKEIHFVLGLTSLAKWGLTGTPKQDDTRAVVAAASLFGVDLVGQSKEEAAFADKAALVGEQSMALLKREGRDDEDFCLEDVSRAEKKEEWRNVVFERKDEYTVNQTTLEDDYPTEGLKWSGTNAVAKFASVPGLMDDKQDHHLPVRWKTDRGYWPCAGCGERNPLPEGAWEAEDDEDGMDDDSQDAMDVEHSSEDSQFRRAIANSLQDNTGPRVAGQRRVLDASYELKGHAPVENAKTQKKGWFFGSVFNFAAAASYVQVSFFGDKAALNDDDAAAFEEPSFDEDGAEFVGAGTGWLIRIGPVKPDRCQTSAACRIYGFRPVPHVGSTESMSQCRICGVHVTVSCRICGVTLDLRSVISDAQP